MNRLCTLTFELKSNRNECRWNFFGAIFTYIQKSIYFTIFYFITHSCAFHFVMSFCLFSPDKMNKFSINWILSCWSINKFKRMNRILHRWHRIKSSDYRYFGLFNPPRMNVLLCDQNSYNLYLISIEQCKF